MHIQHAKTVLDAMHLHENQQVLMASGRAARVREIGPKTIRFDYLDATTDDDYVVLPRHQVPGVVRV